MYFANSCFEEDCFEGKLYSCSVEGFGNIAIISVQSLIINFLKIALEILFSRGC